MSDVFELGRLLHPNEKKVYFHFFLPTFIVAKVAGWRKPKVFIGTLVIANGSKPHTARWLQSWHLRSINFLFAPLPWIPPARSAAVAIVVERQNTWSAFTSTSETTKIRSSRAFLQNTVAPLGSKGRIIGGVNFRDRAPEGVRKECQNQARSQPRHRSYSFRQYLYAWLKLHLKRNFVVFSHP